MVGTVADRRREPDMERIVGQLQGQMEGIQASQKRIEESLHENTRATSKIADEVDALTIAVATIKAEAKMGWKLLTGIAALASVGGASVKHLLDFVASLGGK